MNDTGVFRKIDSLGRVVIPMELRNSFHISERDALRIYVENKRIILEPIKLGCLICGARNQEDYVTVDACAVCLDCAKKIEAAEKLHLKYSPERGETSQ